MRLLFIDVETGGLDPTVNSLLQVGLCVYDENENKIVTQDKFYIKNDFYNITAEAMSINKIDLQKIQQEGISESKAINRIDNLLFNYFEKAPIVVGHNIAFDIEFIQALYKRNYDNFKQRINHRTLDNMSLLWILYDLGLIPEKACSSKGALEYFKINIEENHLHDALYDCKCSVEVYKRIKQLFNNKLGINNEYNMVKEFHKAFNHPYKENPNLLDLDRAHKRYNWIKEEIDEFITATKKQDIVEQADAMIDTIYFALGTLVEMGVQPKELFDIVQKANMSKLWPDGKPHYKEDGKIKKPSTWIDPHDLLAKKIYEKTNNK